jgi:hypothetical protein
MIGISFAVIASQLFEIIDLLIGSENNYGISFAQNLIRTGIKAHMT